MLLWIHLSSNTIYNLFIIYSHIRFYNLEISCSFLILNEILLDINDKKIIYFIEAF